MTWLGWRAIFTFLAGFGLLCLLSVSLFLPETLPAHRRNAHGFGDAAAVWLRLLGTRAFVLPALAGALGFASLFAFISSSPTVFMSLYGVDRNVYGLVYAAVIVGMMLFSQVARLQLRHLSFEKIFIPSIALNAGGTALLALLGPHLGLMAFVALLTISLSGIPLAAATCTARAMAVAVADRGSGSSLLGMMQFVMAGVSSALVAHFYNGTSRTMTLSMCLFGCLSLAVFCPLLRRTAAASGA